MIAAVKRVDEDVDRAATLLASASDAATVLARVAYIYRWP
jgi:hypothetical protein